MRVRTTVEAEVEVDIPLDDVMHAIADLGIPETARQTCRILNTSICVMSSVPDAMVRALTDLQRALIANALEFEAARYRNAANAQPQPASGENNPGNAGR